MTITMLQTRLGSPDGFELRRYYAGKTYDLPQLLAVYFIRCGWARLA